MNLGTGGIRWEETFLWPDAKLQPFENYLLQPGDLCVAMDATFTSAGQIRAGIVESADLPSLLVQRVARLRIADPLLRRFVWLLVTSEGFRDHLLDRQTGAFAPHISGKDIASFEFPLPPQEEQHRIVDLIGALDAQIEATRSEVATVRQARDAARESLLAPKQGSRPVRLGDVLEIARGGSPRPIDDYFTDEPDGINWIKIGDVPRGGKYIDRTAQRIRPEGASRSRRVYPGDFVLSNSMSFGRPYILRIDGCIHDGWLVLSDAGGNFDQDFLYNLLSSGEVQDQFAALASGSAVKNLNIKLVATVHVVVPTLEEQRAVSALLNAFEVALDSLTAGEAALRVLRATLLDRLLRGEVTIPDSYDDVMAEAL